MKIAIKLSLDKNKEEDLILKSNLTLIYTSYSLMKQFDQDLSEISCNIYEGENDIEMNLEVENLDSKLLNDLLCNNLLNEGNL